MSKILVFSADPGGAECLVPIVGALPEGIDAIVMGKNTACQVFEKSFASFLKVNDMKFDDIEMRLNNYPIDAILTSASSLPEKDMTEKLLWKWASSKHVPSVAVLDQWQTYAQRFSGCDPSERLSYLPDKIAIMDEFAKAEMINEGFPENRLCVTGQPALERSGKRIISLKKDYIKKKKLQEMVGGSMVTFFSQPIKDYFGSALGYDENSVLNDIAFAVESIEEKLEKNVVLICKLHPKNKMNDFELIGGKYKKKVIFVRDEYSNEELVAFSDIVVGMGSVMLIHSVLAGIPTICYEPSSARSSANLCMPVKIGAIPLIENKSELIHILYKLGTDHVFLRNYIDKQEKCPSSKGAAANVTALLKSMVKHND